ncbi:NAD(P)-binding protein [Acidianus sulfidivorans JP7]|uniref:Pyridine nucleotide-disulfide oxidoreductase domain-containing protein 2 n=1 Tax=Acidianus sulfidivorans JP7 TaxID=619593 RepID=A0A2U9IPW2_9CREN|nr:NAD(P)/FAD-dependent oxidoreductase [Acidianus sulfidivorans]AWR98052.1 NAD(P)-binding protein [Acidianus sulfidivorans JP7]
MKVAVIGAGHNGLISAYYLRKNGFDVTVFDGRSKVGGMADTEIINGVKISRASYVLGLMPSKLIEEFNIPIIKQNPVQTIYLDDVAIPFWRDKSRRIKELKNVGEEKFEDFENIISKFKSMIEEKFTFVSNPPSKEEIIAEAEKLGVDEVMKLTSREFLSKYISSKYHRFFIYPSMENSSAYLVSYFYADWSFVVGGMGTVAQKIAESAEKLGVKIKLNSKVTKIISNNGVVKGIEVEENNKKEEKKEYDFDLVVSAVSPAETVILADIDAKFPVRKYGWVKYNLIFEKEPKIPQDLYNYRNSIIDCDAGEIVLPYTVDNTINGYVMEMMGDLEEALEMFQGKVIYKEKLTADKAEKDYILPGGDLNHLPMREPFLFDGRPAKGWGYSSPIKGLYLTGAGTYPGGQVVGVSGYNVVLKIMEDLKNKIF